MLPTHSVVKMHTILPLTRVSGVIAVSRDYAEFAERRPWVATGGNNSWS